MTSDSSKDECFADAMQDVEPLVKGRKQAREAKLSVLSVAEQNRRDAAVGKLKQDPDENFLTLGEVPLKDPLEFLEWKKVGVQNAVFERLRKGLYDVDAKLDLHRKTVKEARVIVYDFLNLSQRKSWRNLLISHGKGETSKIPGRLKSYLAAWLEQHEEVNAFCSAQRKKGGVGSVYVLLRKSPEGKELNREEHGFKSDFSQ
jgi:DNA-nicking Smr family endonuclease